MTWITTTLQCIDELKCLFGDKAPSYSKIWFNEFNCGRCSLKDEFLEGPPKTAAVSENLDAVRELIMQDHNATYREIEASLAYIQYCMNTDLFSLDPAQHRSKKVRVDWCKFMLEKYDGCASKHIYKIVTGNELWICAYEPERKQPCGEHEPNSTKVVCGKITSKQMVARFFCKTGHVATVPPEYRRRSILSGTQKFVCLKSGICKWNIVTYLEK